MATDTEPAVGTWYYHTGSGRWLEVLDVDVDDELVSVQYASGEFDQYSLDGWYGLDVEPGAAPQAQGAGEPRQQV